MFYPETSDYPINVTIGFRDIHFLKQHKIEYGKVKILWLDLMVNMYKANVILKYNSDQKIGDHNGTVYINGLLGMLQKREIDLAWAAVPITSANSTADVLGVLIESDFILCSHYTLTSEIYNLMGALENFNFITWSLLICLIISMETLSVALFITSKRYLWPCLRSALETLPGTIFAQYTPANVPKVKLFVTIGLLLITIIFNASFSTRAINQGKAEVVDHLLDIIKFHKIPFITDNVYSLFKNGLTSVFRKIYLYSVKLKTNYHSIDDLQLLNASIDRVIITSDLRCQEYIKLLRLFNNKLIDRTYKSQPFAKSLLVFLVRKGFNGPTRSHKRILTAGKYWLEFGFTTILLKRPNLYYTLRAKGFTDSQLILSSLANEKPSAWSFKQLPLSAYMSQLRFCFIGFVFCLLTLILEIIHFKRSLTNLM